VEERVRQDPKKSGKEKWESVERIGGRPLGEEDRS
jgi:hypothetical protein